jgi:hypothetical protein
MGSPVAVASAIDLERERLIDLAGQKSGVADMA